MRNNFRIDGSLPNSPSNDLGVLRTEIKNQNSFGAILRGTGTFCLQEHYFTDSAKIVKRDRSICSQSLTIPGPIVLRLRQLELSRLLRCVYPDPCRGSKGFGPLKPTPPLAQSMIASGGWNSLACFAAFTPTRVGAREDLAP